ncbi:MAG TPA: hypothetical protein VK469_13155, partial [Candidatus Kapabacteria bacterium]|nr:hypothetical protein [Candidatus Kapabacteria bacterium]
ELKRISCAGGGFKWKVFFDHDQHLPTEMILPYQLIDLLSAYPVDAENTSELSKIMINGYTYHVYFIKALSDYVVGIVQRIANKLRVAPDNFIVYDTTQYTDLPEKKRLAIFKWYLENNPVLREKILLEFFVNILPDSEELRKMI